MGRLGLDFNNVFLVGILDADMLLNRPDFRAYERSYQLMSQVSGRAGRLKKQGKVIVQTGDPDHWVIQLVSDHDYKGFYDNEIIERENFNYPPFYKLIRVNPFGAPSPHGTMTSYLPPSGEGSRWVRTDPIA